MKNIQDVQDTILAVLVPEKKKLHIEVAKLDQLYRDIDGERIPWKELGYPSLVDFLVTIKCLDIYRENGSHYLDFHGTDKTAHLNELVANQRTNKNKKMSSNRKQIPSHYFNNRPFKKVEDDCQLNVETYKTATFFNDESDPEYDDIFEESPSINLNQPTTSDKLKIQNITETSKNLNPSTTSDKLKIQNIIKTSIDIQNNKEIYSTKHGSDKQVVTNYIDQWNDNNTTGVNGGDNNEEGDKYFFDICTKTRERLVKLIQKRPEGIKCAKLPDIYYQEYNEVLDWEDYSCDSLTQFTCNLPEIFHLVKPNAHGDFILYDVTKPRPDSIPDELQEETPDPPRRNNVVPLSLLPVSTQIKNSCLASDVVKLGEYVKPFDTSDPQYQRLITRNWELIDIVDVFSPSFFWIHLHKLTSTSGPSPFEDMMNELHYFYEEKKTEYTIHIEYAVGLNVACKFDQSWHRGIIKEIITAPEKKAKVFFYDYGTMSEYSFSDLYLLKRSFAQLPVQAIPCGLFGVRPIEDDWKPDDRRYFVEKVYGKTLYAMAFHADPETNFLLLNLTDTTGDEDTHFNDDLVNKDIASSGSALEIDLNDLSLYKENWCWWTWFEANKDDTITSELQQIDLPEGFQSYVDYINYLKETIKKLVCDNESIEVLNDKLETLKIKNRELLRELKALRETKKILNLKNQEINEERMSLNAALNSCQNEIKKLKSLIDRFKNEQMRQCATCSRTISRASSRMSVINSTQNDYYNCSAKSTCSIESDRTIMTDDYDNASTIRTIHTIDDFKSDIENYYKRAEFENSIMKNSSKKYLKEFHEFENTIFHSSSNGQKLLETNPFKHEISKNQFDKKIKKIPSAVPPPIPPRKTRK